MGICSAMPFKRSRRELSIGVAEHRSILKNYLSTVGTTPVLVSRPNQVMYSIARTGILFILCSVHNSLFYSYKIILPTINFFQKKSRIFNKFPDFSPIFSKKYTSLTFPCYPDFPWSLDSSKFEGCIFHPLWPTLVLYYVHLLYHVMIPAYDRAGYVAYPMPRFAKSPLTERWSSRSHKQEMQRQKLRE